MGNKVVRGHKAKICFLLPLAFFVSSCGQNAKSGPLVTHGISILEARGVVGTQEVPIVVKGKALRLILEATDDTGAAISARLIRTDDPGGEQRTVQGSCRPDEPFVREIALRSGEYRLRIEATNAFRLRAEEPTIPRL